MKYIKKLFSFLFNFAAVTGLVIAFAVVFGTIFFSYRFMGKMSEQTQLENKKSTAKKTKHLKKPVETDIASNENSEKTTEEIKAAEASKILLSLSQKLAGFDAVDAIEQDMAKTTVPSLCNILCDPSSFNFAVPEEDAEREDPLVYLNAFYKQEQGRAFADPKFRLAMETALAYSGLFPGPARQVISEVGQVLNQTTHMSEVDKLALSAKFPFLVLKVGTQVAGRLDELQARANRAGELTQLRKTCTHKKIQDVVRECESLAVVRN